MENKQLNTRLNNKLFLQTSKLMFKFKKIIKKLVCGCVCVCVCVCVCLCERGDHSLSITTENFKISGINQKYSLYFNDVIIIFHS